MAFTVTNLKTVSIGGAGTKLTTFQWTGSVGDATGTVNVQGGLPFMIQAWANAAGGWVQAPASFTSTGTVITLTFENVAGVTDGYASILHR